MTLRSIVVLAGLGASLAIRSGAAEPQPASAWRHARWGMTAEEVLAAFPGEATRLDPEQRLADGNVVSVGIESFVLKQQRFRVRFVFEAGRLALVSLRTPPDSAVDAAVYERLQKELAREFGTAGEASRDTSFVDLRQTRWQVGRSLVDLKYIPGTVVVLYHPAPAAAR